MILSSLSRHGGESLCGSSIVLNMEDLRQGGMTGEPRDESSA
jgi:hypothetical protein